MSRITIDENGFDLISDSGEPIARVEWLELDRIEAYKTDFVTVDQICLDFFSGDRLTTITEDDKGFEDLAPALIANLDLENSDWFQAVMKPTFQPTRTLVYDREAGY